MRILHVIHSVDPRSGGPSHALRGLLRQQIDRGHQVSVVSTETQSAEPWAPPCDYRQSITTDPAFDGAEVFLGRALGRYRPLSRFAYSRSCRRWLSERLSDPCLRPQVVHIHGVFSHVTSAAARLARRHRVPYILRPAGALDEGCLAMGRKGLKAVFRGLFVQKDLRRAAAVQATSQSEADGLLRLCPNAPIRVVPHGVDIPQINRLESRERLLSRFPEMKGRRILLCMARLHPIKRIDLAIEAVHLLSSEDDDPPLLLIAGHDSGHLAVLWQMVESLRLGEHVKFLGFLQGNQKDEVLSAADVFILPSIHENFGVAVVEAMSHGMPVLVTPGVASHTYVDRSAAGLTVEGTVDALADGIRQLINGDCAAMGQRGRAFVQEHLSWPAVVNQMDHLCEEILARHGTAVRSGSGE